MVRLVQKCGYIRAGGAQGYLAYIATRERVEKLPGNGPPTQKQLQLIRQLLRDFPDAQELFEYEDYLASPTQSNASAFITMALDVNAHSLQERSGYLRYMALRPNAQRRGAHGLFGSTPSVSLDSTQKELDEHKGNVWTLIYSLRREDAARLGYDNAAKWRELLIGHAPYMAEGMKIPVEQLRWYAAYHDEGHHPHIHVMVWSTDPKQGYLSKNGITTMRSKLANEMFRDELHELYAKKDLSYKEVTAAARAALDELTRHMENALWDAPSLELKLAELARELKTVTGKKQYGYLPKPLKAQVDAIVDELAAHPEVARCYGIWNELRDELEGYYKAIPRTHQPLSRQKEFRAIKNLVIREVEQLGKLTFEDESMEDEPPEPEHGQQTVYQQAADYRAAKAVFLDADSAPVEKEQAVYTLEALWEDGYTIAAHLLGRVYRDGLYESTDEAQAEVWFLRSAQAGNACSQYALGKLLQAQKRMSEALSWYERADAGGDQFARYRLGKLYLLGVDVPKDISKALDYLTASANQGNQYAQYTLGKLYLLGREVQRDREEARHWLELSAAQGNEYAQFFLDRFDQFRDPSMLLCATKLLHHLSRVFRGNSVPPTNPVGIRMDSKRRRKLLNKRLAMGHKIDDHEEQQYPSM